MEDKHSGDRGEPGSLRSEGYQKALEILGRCSSEHGFLATPTEEDNYRRIWGRDGCITGLAALRSGEEELIRTCEKTLRTLVEFRGPHGEIPSNVNVETGRISYGGTTGRVDADLWFLICCGQYWRATGDGRFLEEMGEAIDDVRRLLGCWEFNNRGLLFVPPTGDWADEYVQSGYVLYDNLLYLQAQRELIDIFEALDHGQASALEDRSARLERLIRKNYWFEDCDKEHGEDVYHSVLYDRGCRAAEHCRGLYWMPFFSTTGYGFRFDTFANVLTSLLGVADEERADKVDDHIAREIVDEETMLLPAFLPVITPREEEWDDLQVTFTYEFKNEPYEYHNGGQWPMLNGFYVASLAGRSKTGEAERFLEGLHRANKLSTEGEPWSFPEFVHGKKHTPGGVRHMAWSAAGAVLGESAMRGEQIFKS